MRSLISQYLSEIDRFTTQSADELEQFRIRYLSKKGLIPALFEDFKNVPPEQRREIGQALNDLKNKAQEKVTLLREQIEAGTSEQKGETDLTLPVDYLQLGSRHPLSIVREEIIRIFARIGFVVAEGPEIEDDWHNFTALNFQPDHPARDMQDTFFIESNPDILLRTHTSSVQIRAMETRKPPLREIYPGRVFRNEAISARAHCIFHQVEGLYVDHDVSFADLKQTLYYFAHEMFGEGTEVRFRPSYFPFTEPSAEMDVTCFVCGGKGCPICKYSGWVEILGCGMVDPSVPENCGINSNEYTGFAFGMGIERITMLKFRIQDIRLFFENDVRFLKQFTGAV
ncbi:MAG: phenylalanine--tRNA ligase subunit alpha [Bacteroidales bacterium]|nr:phenylalanine--tRNA ligase subunit alpha [Bacteroidales bacterium]